ncbi:efflux RND transporter periplasmic adaptor subunit [Candidatus Woesebacteria bacterium]|nr:efflux RND transporter periplasmic adaptor subunit [Candidatus Woesebacteria bacterium]
MEDKKEKTGSVKRLFKRKGLIAIIIVVIVGIAIRQFFIVKKNGDYDTTEVKRGSIAQELILTGEIVADRHSSLRFPYSGKLAWVGVSEGESVKEDTFLMRLDTTSISQDLKIADANLRQKAATLDRVYDDLKDKQDTEDYSEIETRTAAETNKDVTVFSHIKAQYTLAEATLRAPFAGVVTSIANSTPGEYVLFSETQVEIVDPDTIFFQVAADQSEVVDIHEGQKVVIVLDSFSDEEFVGMVDFVGLAPIAGEIGTLYEVKVKFVGKEFDLTKVKIGMTGDAKFILEEKVDALYIPLNYINSDKDGKYLYLGKGEDKVYVETGLESEDYIEVISGEINEGIVIHD